MLKLNIKKQNLFVLTIFLVLSCSSVVLTQTKQLAENDKTQIIQAILTREDFKNPNICCFNNKVENIVYLLAENISVKQLPKFKNIKFVLITQAQIDEMEKTGVEYYSFGEFEVRKSSVHIYFSRKFTNASSGELYGNDVKYICRKYRGKWKIKERSVSAHAS